MCSHVNYGSERKCVGLPDATPEFGMVAEICTGIRPRESTNPANSGTSASQAVIIDDQVSEFSDAEEPPLVRVRREVPSVSRVRRKSLQLSPVKLPKPRTPSVALDPDEHLFASKKSRTARKELQEHPDGEYCFSHLFNSFLPESFVHEGPSYREIIDIVEAEGKYRFKYVDPLKDPRYVSDDQSVEDSSTFPWLQIRKSPHLAFVHGKYHKVDYELAVDDCNDLDESCTLGFLDGDIHGNYKWEGCVLPAIKSVDLIAQSSFLRSGITLNHTYLVIEGRCNLWFTNTAHNLVDTRTGRSLRSSDNNVSVASEHFKTIPESSQTGRIRMFTTKPVKAGSSLLRAVGSSFAHKLGEVVEYDGSPSVPHTTTEPVHSLSPTYSESIYDYMPDDSFENTSLASSPRHAANTPIEVGQQAEPSVRDTRVQTQSLPLRKRDHILAAIQSTSQSAPVGSQDSPSSPSPSVLPSPSDEITGEQALEELRHICDPKLVREQIAMEEADEADRAFAVVAPLEALLAYGSSSDSDSDGAN